MSNLSIYNPNKTGYSQQDALVTKLSALGISDFSKAQGSTKVIFDTITGTAAGIANLDFFSQNRQLPDSNFNQRFGVMEAMIIEKIVIASGNTQEGLFWNPGYNGTEAAANQPYFSVKIGNSVVLENYPLYGTNFQVGSGDKDSVQPYQFQLNSLLVIPPDTDFELKVYNWNAPTPPAEQQNQIKVMIEGTALELSTKF